MLKAICATVILALAGTLPLHAQFGLLGKPANVDHSASYLDDDTLFTSVFAGGGISSDGTQRPTSAHVGGSAGLQTLSSHPGGLGSMGFLEAGAIGPLANRNAPAAFVGYDLGADVLLSRNTRTVPFAVAGYSYLFGVGHAINFGVGADVYYRPYRAIRVEVRDYYTFADSPQHNVAVRIGWQFSIHDP